MKPIFKKNQISAKQLSVRYPPLSMILKNEKTLTPFDKLQRKQVINRYTSRDIGPFIWRVLICITDTEV